VLMISIMNQHNVNINSACFDILGKFRNSFVTIIKTCT